MKKTALVITIGTRDISIPKEDFIKVFSEEKWASIHDPKGNQIYSRAFGKILLQEYDKLYQKLAFPIIEPAMAYCTRKEEKINHIILVATDQVDAEEIFTKKDSIFFAQILRKILFKKYRNILGKDQPIRILTIRKNAGFLDNLVDFFDDKKNVPELYALRDHAKVYVLNQGGIPSINTALLLKSIALFGASTELLRVNEKNQKCLPLNFTLQFLEADNKKLITGALSNYDYSTVLKIAKNTAVLQLAQYALSRLHFDFQAAEDSLLELRKSTPQPALKFLTKLDGITSSRFNLLQEIYVNARIKLHQKAYVDFLLRCFRIAEEYARLNAFKHLDFEFNHLTFGKDFSNFLKKPENRPLHTFLEKQTFNRNDKLKYTIANTPTFIAINKFYNPSIVAHLKKIRTLSTIRNQSIAAHNFDPVSLEIIEDALRKNNTSLQELLTIFDGLLNFSTNPFDEINKEIELLL